MVMIGSFIFGTFLGDKSFEAYIWLRNRNDGLPIPGRNLSSDHREFLKNKMQISQIIGRYFWHSGVNYPGMFMAILPNERCVVARKKFWRIFRELDFSRSYVEIDVNPTDEAEEEIK